MKVYLVTSGEYSDYSINGIFSTRTLAHAFIEEMNKEEIRVLTDDENIEEWEVDAQVSARTMTAWQCGIMLDTGEIIEGPYKYDSLCRPFRGEVLQEEVAVPMYGMRKITRVCSGISADHARKLAVEARQAWLRKEAFEPEGVEE